MHQPSGEQFSPANTESIRSACSGVGLSGAAAFGPSLLSFDAKPDLGYAVAYATSAVFIVRRLPTALASLAAMRERSRLGMAIAASTKAVVTPIPVLRL